MGRDAHATRRPKEQVLLCGLILDGQTAEAEGPLSEAAGLAEAAGSEVIGPRIVQRLARPVSATMLGSGKVAEIKRVIELERPDAVVVDNDLSPAQGRNLEKAWGCRIVDRSELIMDIFARRAQTRQARLQVELAQTQYMMPRLRRMWTHLERMEGAIGTRGPGETQLETDRRLIKKRIRDLKRELDDIEGRKRRQVRTRDEEFTVGLVGYTNAGKSTLLNRLTGSHELAEDMLFATLDTRTRRWALEDGRHVLLSDTVGFLQRLPHHLVASFHATLEEALNVDLLLHVIDASHPDAEVHLDAVDEVLDRVGGKTRSEILVLNKVDGLEDRLRLATLVERDGGRQSIAVSARTGEGLAELEAAVVERLDRRSALVRATIPFEHGQVLASLRASTSILEEQHDAEQGSILIVRVADRELGNLQRKAPAGVRFEVLEEPEEPYLMQEPDAPAFEGVAVIEEPEPKAPPEDPETLAG
jgi:GTPase